MNFKIAPLPRVLGQIAAIASGGRTGLVAERNQLPVGDEEALEGTWHEFRLQIFKTGFSYFLEINMIRKAYRFIRAFPKQAWGKIHAAMSLSPGPPIL
jgi:hypothetical protein